MGKSTISMAIFNSKLLNYHYQRVSELSELSTSAKHRHFSWSNAAPWADGVSQTPSGPMKSPGHRHSLGVFGLFSALSLIYLIWSALTKNRKPDWWILMTRITHEITWVYDQWCHQWCYQQKEHPPGRPMGPPLHASSDVGQLGSPGPPRWPCQMQGIDLGSRYFAIETP